MRPQLHRFGRWGYEGAMAALAIVAVWLVTLPPTSRVELASYAIWGLFVADYVVRLVRAPDRRRFVREHVIELIAILPWDVLRIARVLRLVRLLRVLRAGIWFWRATRAVREIATQNGLLYVLAAASGIVLVGSAVFRVVEPGVKSYSEALWWAIVTVTTVGYGDIAPRTAAGRLVAVVLMLVGIGVLGMVTSSLATYFLGVRRRATHPTVEHVRERMAEWDTLVPSERRQLAALLWVLAHEPESLPDPPPQSAEVVRQRLDALAQHPARSSEGAHLLGDQARQ